MARLIRRAGHTPLPRRTPAAATDPARGGLRGPGYAPGHVGLGRSVACADQRLAGVPADDRLDRLLHRGRSVHLPEARGEPPQRSGASHGDVTMPIGRGCTPSFQAIRARQRQETRWCREVGRRDQVDVRLGTIRRSKGRCLGAPALASRRERVGRGHRAATPACGGEGGGGDGVRSGGGGDPVAEPEVLSSGGPVGALFTTKADESLRVQHGAIEHLIAKCMKDKGFAYKMNLKYEGISLQDMSRPFGFRDARGRPPAQDRPADRGRAGQRRPRLRGGVERPERPAPAEDHR